MPRNVPDVDVEVEIVWLQRLKEKVILIPDQFEAVRGFSRDELEEIETMSSRDGKCVLGIHGELVSNGEGMCVFKSTMREAGL